MSERVTADDVMHVETKIIMTEDKMFRDSREELLQEAGNQRRDYISEEEITEDAVSI